MAAAALAGAVLLSPAPVDAQAEDPFATSPGFAAADSVEVGWSGSADFGYTLTDGNSETTNISLAALLERRWQRWRWTTDGSYLRATTDGDETANRGGVSTQADYFPGGRFFLFVRAAASFNQPAGLDLRLAPAAGAGYQILSRQRVQLSVEGGGSWIRDEFTSGPADEAVHVSVGQDFAWEIADDTNFQQSLLYEPKADEIGDFLLTAQASLTTMITEALGLKLSFRDEFDSEPFVDPATGEEREDNDITFITGVTFRF